MGLCRSPLVSIHCRANSDAGPGVHQRARALALAVLRRPGTRVARVGARRTRRPITRRGAARRLRRERGHVLFAVSAAELWCFREGRERDGHLCGQLLDLLLRGACRGYGVEQRGGRQVLKVTLGSSGTEIRRGLGHRLRLRRLLIARISHSCSSRLNISAAKETTNVLNIC